MKTSIITLIMIIFLFGCKEDKTETADISTELRNILVRQWSAFQADKPQNPSGIGIYFLKNSTVYSASYNLPAGQFASMYFRAASTTKTYTAAAILLLEQEGKLNIDDTITELIPGRTIPYVPDDTSYAIPYKNRITIRMLLNHRAGVFDVTNYPIPDTVQAPYAGLVYPNYLMDIKGPAYTFNFDELVRPVAKHHLSFFPPDSGFHYSNTDYDILGKIIENISDLPYSEFIRTRFIDPLELRESRMIDLGSDTLLPSPSVNSYLHYEGKIYEITGSNLSSSRSEGNLVTTPRDLARWAQLLYTGQSGLNPPGVTKMTSLLPTGEQHEFYGLGCEGGPPDLGYGHNGAHDAYMTVMRLLPSGWVVVVVTNYLESVDVFTQGGVLCSIIRESEGIIESAR